MEISLLQAGKFPMELIGENPDIPQMVGGKDVDRYRARLLQLSKQPGPSLEILSEKIGKKRGYLRDYVSKGSPRKLDGDDRSKLAGLLKVPESELGDLGEPRTDPPPKPNNAQPAPAIHPEPFMSGKRDLPVRGRAKAGEDGHYIEETSWAATTTFRPHLLEGVPDAYAVEVWDDSMHPVLRHGWMLWIHPGKPVRAGDAVVIQLGDGQALVKELVRRTDKEWVFHQFKPDKDIRYARDLVKSVHLVVGNSRGML